MRCNKKKCGLAWLGCAVWADGWVRAWVGGEGGDCGKWFKGIMVWERCWGDVWEKLLE